MIFIVKLSADFVRKKRILAHRAFFVPALRETQICNVNHYRHLNESNQEKFFPFWDSYFSAPTAFQKIISNVLQPPTDNFYTCFLI